MIFLKERRRRCIWPWKDKWFCRTALPIFQVWYLVHEFLSKWPLLYKQQITGIFFHGVQLDLLPNFWCLSKKKFLWFSQNFFFQIWENANLKSHMFLSASLKNRLIRESAFFQKGETKSFCHIHIIHGPAKLFRK